MATVGGVSGDALVETRTKARGRVDRLVAAVDVLPGPAATWYAAMAALLIIAAHLFVWASGAHPWGTLEPEVVAPPLLMAYVLWVLHLQTRVAGESFEDFRPALNANAHDLAAHRANLTSIPDWLAIVAIIVVEAIISGSYYLFVRPARPPLPAAVDLASWVLWSLGVAVLTVLLLQTVRQLRQVSRLSGLADNVDIFQPAPINAFSRLTAVSAMGILGMVALFVLANPEQQPALVVQEVLIVGLAVASFVLPLRVMHRRLALEKSALQAQAQERLKRVLARIHEVVDADDFAGAGHLDGTLATLQAEREVLARLPTWPWSAGTLRGVATAVLLPIALFVVTRLIDRLL